MFESRAVNVKCLFLFPLPPKWTGNEKMHFTFSNLDGRRGGGGVIKKTFFRRTQETTALIFMSQSFRRTFSGKSCACFFLF